MGTVLSLSPHFLFLFIFDRCSCPSFRLMKRTCCCFLLWLFHCSIVLPPSSSFLFSSSFAQHAYFRTPGNLPPPGLGPRQTLSASWPWPGTCWEPLWILSVSLCPSHMYCLLLGRSWPGGEWPILCQPFWISMHVTWMSSFTHWEKGTLPWEAFLFRYLQIQTHVIFYFSGDWVDVWLNSIGF